jgi:hypothetical protein
MSPDNISRMILTCKKKDVDVIVRRCVPEHEQQDIIRKWYSSAYGGHHPGTRTRAKVLQFNFYWPTLFKDLAEFVKYYDEYPRATSNIGKRQEMPIFQHGFATQAITFLVEQREEGGRHC